MTQTTTAQDAGYEVVNAWRRNFQVGADAARALRAESAHFAEKLLDLNLQAARAIGTAGASDARLATPFALGASAVELCFGYLGRSAALAQQAIILPWKEPKA
ncbi:MAG TPA: hypothetical protein VJS38_18835 [Phenylobacterium sp.]|uniref:hypothetical protein n=1 Tax=Phenylobacterium sp. TaxID=1871053 RepID=UPI002B466EBC|nr:hypothetical protein [Phenylobacterium sp.]HKR90229.1 hypothetical protein [Phenylobacterium sp.]